MPSIYIIQHWISHRTDMNIPVRVMTKEETCHQLMHEEMCTTCDQHGGPLQLHPDIAETQSKYDDYNHNLETYQNACSTLGLMMKILPFGIPTLR